MPDSLGRNYSDELCDIEADRVANMKLKIARTFYGAYAWEPETQSWNWENECMQGFYAWLQRYNGIVCLDNIKVFLASDDFATIARNTVLLNLLFIFKSFFALLP